MGIFDEGYNQAVMGVPGIGRRNHRGGAALGTGYNDQQGNQ